MNKKAVSHPEAKNDFTTGAFSPGVVVDGWVYVSGQAAVDFPTASFKLGTIEEETHLTIYNIRRILEAAGCTLEDVVKCTVHLADIHDFDAYNKIYASYFTGIKPARTTVQSLMANNIKIEIDAIARIKHANP